MLILLFLVLLRYQIAIPNSQIAIKNRFNQQAPRKINLRINWHEQVTKFLILNCEFLPNKFGNPNP
jgi:hypothetical protein